MATRTEYITSLEFSLYFCRGIPCSHGAQRAIDLLRGQQAIFLDWGKPVTDLKLEPVPSGVLSKDGSILGLLQLQHNLLAYDVGTRGDVVRGQRAAEEDAYGSFAFFADTQTVSVAQNADETNQLGVDADIVATGLLALAVHFYPCLEAGYGWVDESGWNLPSGKALASPQPRYLYWATFYGAEHVQALGRDFLLGAPGWRIVDLPNGGLLHVATESYREWWTNDQPELLEYFRRKLPKVRIYRAQPIP
jgi:hypothetical protein